MLFVCSFIGIFLHYLWTVGKELLKWSKFDPYQDNNTCPSYQVLLSRNPQLSESIPKPPPLLTTPELPSVPKIFLIRNHMLPLRRPYHSGTFHNFCLQLRVRSSNNRSSLISVVTYVTPSFPTLIMCNALSTRAVMDSDRISCM